MSTTLPRFCNLPARRKPIRRATGFYCYLSNILSTPAPVRRVALGTVLHIVRVQPQPTMVPPDATCTHPRFMFAACHPELVIFRNADCSGHSPLRVGSIHALLTHSTSLNWFIIRVGTKARRVQQRRYQPTSNAQMRSPHRTPSTTVGNSPCFGPPLLLPTAPVFDSWEGGWPCSRCWLCCSRCCCCCCCCC